MVYGIPWQAPQIGPFDAHGHYNGHHHRNNFRFHTGWNFVFLPVMFCVALTPLVLQAVGFAAVGVAAGSFIAIWHSSIGNIAAGSVFAILQSAGAGGAGLFIANGLICGPVVAWSAYHAYRDSTKSEDTKDNKYEYKANWEETKTGKGEKNGYGQYGSKGHEGGKAKREH